jgi:hypothetical protein
VSPLLETCPGILQLSWHVAFSLDRKHMTSNLVPEDIGYLAHLSYPSVLEHVILSTEHHLIQLNFAVGYEVCTLASSC